MGKPTTAAQRRIIEAADPETGRLTGSEAQLAGLVRLRLAFRHPRPPHAYFLTPAGHRIREGEPDPAPAPRPPAADSSAFAARTGTEQTVPATTGPARAREVRSAWEGLIELRRMTNPDGSRERPCGWERSHLVQAAALALESAGCHPAGPSEEGYRVESSAQPEAVTVRAPGPEALRGCAAALEGAGWQVSEHAEPRARGSQGARCLLASPRRT
ncbi:hypothetical protein [Streptomyces sp. NPDC059009]|uniref:hypothetical protein n=1 Tax=Streptomyces sp. NPDC059009 TaxID=3346694 RepID=UPI00368F3244